MNCPKCNTVLRAGAKFCTSCGQKIEASMECPQCRPPLKPGPKFCTKCGHRMVPAEKAPASPQPEASDLNTVKGRIYWNIQPGQVARVISEAEFDSYNKIQGKALSYRKEQQHISGLTGALSLLSAAGVMILRVHRNKRLIMREEICGKDGNLLSIYLKAASGRREIRPGRNFTGSSRM